MESDDNNYDPVDEQQAKRSQYRHRTRSDEPPGYSRSPLERVMSELIKRGIEAGRDTLKQTDEVFRTVSDPSFARELVNQFFSHFGDIRQILSKTIAQEVGKVLKETDIASELRKVMNEMTIEANIKVTFPPREESEEGKGEEEPVSSTS